MTVDPNYRTWLQLLQQRTIVTEEGKLKVAIKRIPELDQDGVLDPRVLNISKSMRLGELLKQEEADKQAEQSEQTQQVERDGPAEQSQQAEQALQAERDGQAQPSEPEGSFPLAQIRASMGWPNIDLTSGVTTIERQIAGTEAAITIRIYTPSVAGLKPAIVFFHGGGFIGGSLKTVENPCKGLAEKAGAVVVSVDYRLAPEHPFPAGLTDCWDTVAWIYEHAEQLEVDRDWIAVAGDSAGGNLSAVCSIIDREKGKNYIKYQALIYPTVCMTATNPYFKWSIDQYTINEEAELMTDIVMGLAPKENNFIRDLYTQGKVEAQHPHVSPIFTEHVSQLPTALIVTAEYDGLKVEGKAYAARLAAAGVDTTYMCYKGMDHAFMDKYGLYPQAEDLMAEIADGFKSVIAKG